MNCHTGKRVCSIVALLIAAVPPAVDAAPEGKGRTIFGLSESESSGPHFEGGETLENLYQQGTDLMDSWEGDWEILKRAERYFREILRRDPNSAPGYAGLSRVFRSAAYRSGSDYDPAILKQYALPYAERARDLDPAFPPAYSVLAIAYEGLERFTEAEAAARKRLELAPTDGRSYTLLSDILVRQKRVDEALALLEQGLQYTELISGKRRKIYMEKLARAYQRKGDFAKTEEYYRKAIDADPDTSWTHSNLGSFYVQMGRYDDAVREAEAALRIADFGMARHLLATARGQSLMQNKQYEQAIPDLEESFRVNPEQGLVGSKLGHAYLEIGQNQKAIDVIRKVHKHSEPTGYSWHVLAAAHQNLGQLEEALSAAKMGIQKDPNNAILHFIAAQTQLELRGPSPEVEALVLRYLELDPDSKLSPELKQFKPRDP